MGCGAFALLEEVTRDRVRSFVDDAGRFAPALAALAGRMDGTPEVLRVIGHRLGCDGPAHRRHEHGPRPTGPRASAQEDAPDRTR
jgi:hypothetical protein